MDSNALVCTDVSVAFGGLRALDSVSTSFILNNITGLVGPNGAGKTTLINAITNYVPLASGRVRLGTTDITGKPSERIARLGVVRTFQIPKTPGGITVHNLLDTTMANTNHNITKIGEFSGINDVGEFCGIADLLQTDCGSLSLPQLRRVEIARALACGPHIIMLDEAMAGLGEDDIHDNCELVIKINSLGIGFVLIEHVMSVIRRLCSHVLVLNNGRWLLEGTPDDVFSSSEVHKAYVGEDTDGF